MVDYFRRLTARPGRGCRRPCRRAPAGRLAPVQLGAHSIARCTSTGTRRCRTTTSASSSRRSSASSWRTTAASAQSCWRPPRWRWRSPRAAPEYAGTGRSASRRRIWANRAPDRPGPARQRVSAARVEALSSSRSSPNGRTFRRAQPLEVRSMRRSRCRRTLNETCASARAWGHVREDARCVVNECAPVDATEQKRARARDMRRNAHRGRAVHARMMPARERGHAAGSNVRHAPRDAKRGANATANRALLLRNLAGHACLPAH